MNGLLLTGAVLLAAATSAAEPPEASPRALRAALDDALAGAGPRAAARIEVECARDGRMPALVVYGRGVGIWDGRRQFALAEDRVTALLREVRASGFDGFPESFGEGVERDAALRVVCRVAVDLGAVGKQVVQFAEGEQSAALRRLAEALYALCEPAARTGIEAADLEEGLAAVGRGELAPETFELALHRKPELNGSPGGEGFLLRIAGGGLSLRGYSAASGYGEPVSRRAAPGEISALAAKLAGLRPGRLPANLWAPDYVDLEIRVLDRRVAVQARGFTGMTPATHGDVQRDFDALLAALAPLGRGLDTPSGDHP